MGVRVLTKVQYGLESPHGTPVAADTMLLCKATLPEADREIHIPQVQMGTRTPGLISAAMVSKILADGIGLEDADGAYFQLFPILFSMAIKNITPAEQNPSEGDYLWDAPAPQTAAESVDSVTLEVGDDTQAYEIAYCLARSLRISGNCETGECHVAADLFGDKVTQTTITGAIAVPSSVELVNSKLAKIYIDGTWANLGTTELANALVDYDVNLNFGVHPKFHGSASRLFAQHGQSAITGEASFTFERISGVATEELNYRPASGYAQTMRCVRLEILGTQIGTGDVQTLTIDLAGLWTGWRSLGSERDGDNLDVAKLTIGYDVTGTQSCRVAVITDVTAI